MKRFERFILSQIVWIVTVAFLLLNLDWLHFSDNAFLIIGSAIGIAMLINLGIWFGEGIARAFDDDVYEKLADKPETESVEKRKRERLDTVLRDLSNDDLIALRERLQDGTIDDEILYEQMVGDDGELIRLNQENKS